jgi:hypothetical protein
MIRTIGAKQLRKECGTALATMFLFCSLTALSNRSVKGADETATASQLATRNELERIAAALEASRAEAKDQGCERGLEDRKSDLCAQWKAADGATSAANAAWMLGIIGALIGAATLIAASKAALYAKAAARHTEAGANEARRGADAAEKALAAAADSFALQLASARPIMVFDPAALKVQGWPFSEPWNSETLRNTLTVVHRFENVGSQPCWIVANWFGFYISKFDDRGQLHLPDDFESWFRGDTAGFIQPRKGIDSGGGHYGISEEQRIILENGGGLIICGMCQYRSLDKRLFATQFAYQAPVTIGNVASSGSGMPVNNAAHWRDGLVAAPRMLHGDPVIWLD